MRFLFIFCFLFSLTMFSQEDIVAQEYFKNGEFEKALMLYKRLYKQKPNNSKYVIQLVKIHQQLEQYDEVQTLLEQQILRIKFPAYYVELGYNYSLMNNSEKANESYAKAIASLDENPSYVYSVSKSFEDHSLLNQAIVTYEKAKKLKPQLNFNIQLARIYGEQGNVEKMFASYLNFVETNNSYLNNIKRNVREFISEDSNNENNVLLRKILLKKIQQNPNLLWNEMLSWLFVQQKDYKKAFIQEQAIFNRKPESLQRILELTTIVIDENENEVAKEILQYLINTAQETGIVLSAHNNLLQLEIKEAQKEDYPVIQKKYLDLFTKYGKFTNTLDLQIAYAHFLAFNLNDTHNASSFLKEALVLPLSLFEQSQVKMELGDILVLQEKFNEALIYYTQIQRSLKNSTISQDARFKVAKTSYFKGDFQWAESQLKVLKSSTSQLIANDALDLKLLISDNRFEDSLQIALKLYAKADLLAFQNKNDEAIKLLDTILKNHKTETIIDQALFKQAQLFELKNDIEKAEANYNRIITDYKEDILADDALFALAELYLKKLDQPEKAKEYYEQILFNYADSIYFVESRKKYRLLRGDSIN